MIPGVSGGSARRRIYILGFMGAGKTSVGECLARELSWRFIDLDREIEKGAGLTIPEIFRSRGEPAFRRIEAIILREVAAVEDVVVACGGGTPAAGGNLDLILSSGFSVWLDAPLDVMMQRCGAGSHRPLLADRPKMETLLAARRPCYMKADLRVDASGADPARLASIIAAELSRLLSA